MEQDESCEDVCSNDNESMLQKTSSTDKLHQVKEHAARESWPPPCKSSDDCMQWMPKDSWCSYSGQCKDCFNSFEEPTCEDEELMEQDESCEDVCSNDNESMLQKTSSTDKLHQVKEHAGAG